jgi:hypothetical protein
MKITYLTKEQIQERIAALDRIPKSFSREQIRQRIQDLAITNLVRYTKHAVRS